MRRGLLTALVAAILFALPASAAPTVRPYTDAEALAKLVDECELLVLARVLEVDTTVRAESVTFDPAFPPDMIAAMKNSGPRLRRSRLEAVAWLKGGLDGDTFDVYSLEGTGAQLVEPPGWRALAGVDTLAAFVALTRRGADWVLRSDPAAGLAAGFRPIGQSGFRALTDSCAAARARLAPDSLLAGADLVAITGPSAEAGAPGNQMAIERVLAGSAPPGEILVRTARARFRPGRRLLALRHTADGAYEPVPFHRLAWMSGVSPTGLPDATPEKVEVDVMAALERLAKAGLGPATRGAKKN